MSERDPFITTIELVEAERTKPKHSPDSDPRNHFLRILPPLKRVGERFGMAVDALAPGRTGNFDAGEVFTTDEGTIIVVNCYADKLPSAALAVSRVVEMQCDTKVVIEERLQYDRGPR